MGGSEKSRLRCGSGGSEKNRLITGAVDYRIWGLMQQRLYKTPVRDTIDLKKRLVFWHMGQHLAVRRRRSRWPVDSTATRMREGKRSPVRTSAPVINRFFSEPPEENTYFLRYAV